MRDVVIVSAGANEGWLYRIAGASVCICTPGGWWGRQRWQCDKRTPASRDGQSLLSFVVQNYERLPDRIAFVHGHSQAWHQPQSFVSQFKHALFSNRSFVHLSNRRVVRRFDNTGWCPSLWARYIGRCPRVVSTYQGMQFIADGALVRNTPFAVWKQLEEIAYGNTSIAEFRDKVAGNRRVVDYLRLSYVLEWTVHILLGQPERLWTGSTPILDRCLSSLGPLRPRSLCGSRAFLTEP